MSDLIYKKFENSSSPNWDELFMRHVYLIASKSKDPRTKVGAILVYDGRIISQGYNGPPRNVNDKIAERHISPKKYFFYEHAERNSLFNCAYCGIKAHGAILFTQGQPCCDCMRGIINSGIKEIVLHTQWTAYEAEFGRDKWKESFEVSKQMAEEAGVPIRNFSQKLNLKGYLDGYEIDI